MLAIIIRFIQGLGSACIQVAVFSLVAIQFPDDKVVYFGYCESATGIGLMAGPIIGQVFYSKFGFAGCFYSTTLLLTMAGLLSWRYIPQEVNQGKLQECAVEDQKMDLEDIEMEMIAQEVDKETSMVCYVRNPRVMMPLLSCILGTIFLLFSEPIISDHLIELGLSEDYIGFIFAGSCLSYAISAPVVGFLTKTFSKESLTLFAYILSAMALCI